MHHRELRPEEYEAHFNPRVAATDFEGKVAALDARSRAARERYAHAADVRYGPGPKETLDVFPAPRPGAPVLVFIHGGYWRAMDKSGYSFVAPPFVDAGAAVVVINYDLAPAVTLDAIVAETMRAIAWTYRHVGEHGGDPQRIHVCGNSAGGHLAAMALAHDWEAEGLPGDLVKGASPMTGVFDCEPVLETTVNDDVRLDPEAARRLSPIHLPPRRPVPVIVSVGGAEPAAWIQMSKDYAALCETNGNPVEYLELPGMDHFDVSGAVGDPASPLTRAMLAQMGLGPPGP